MKNKDEPVAFAIHGAKMRATKTTTSNASKCKRNKRDLKLKKKRTRV